MSRTSLRVGSCFALVLALLVWGCGSSGGGAVPFNATAGAHPATWLQDHWAYYLASPNQCTTCHGALTDPSGGITQVSCLSCHTQGVPHPNPTGWAAPGQHGRNGAELAPVATNNTTVPVMAGFSHCAKCHGAAYDGGLAGVSCRSCHKNAPHPSKPWFDLTGATPSHTFANPANASECAKCHTGGANSDLQPINPPPAGTAPGCFNATLCHSMGAHTTTWLQDHWAVYLQDPALCVSCHGAITNPSGGIAQVACVSCHTQGVPHPDPAGWAAPGQHGRNGAELAPVVTTAPTIPVMAGFSHCAKCHGVNYDGGLANVSCKSCHQPAPHPSKPWFDLTGATPSHTFANPANASECAKCHTGGTNSDLKPINPPPAGTAPGCFNATLCHSMGAHTTSWLQDHWAVYLQGPALCVSCHGAITDPSGGLVKVSCVSCHTQGVPHPDPVGWAAPGQHGRNGAELAPVATTAPTIPVMAGFSHCAKCHGTNYDGGLAAVSCMSCHKPSPHPSKPWFDITGATPSHTFANPANASECAKCHTGGTNSDIQPINPPPAGTAPGCFNATLCHSMGAHTTTWLQDHWAVYLQGPALCVSCHGATTDPTGGIAQVSCLSCHTQGIPHSAGWAAAASHGANGAMLAPVPTNSTTVPVMAGFSHCQKCHGSALDGGLAGLSCRSCHATAPHPPKPWLPDSGYVPLSGHYNVDVSNLPVCAGCHTLGTNSDTKPVNPAPAGTPPGCTNGTLCHG